MKKFILFTMTFILMMTCYTTSSAADKKETKVLFNGLPLNYYSIDGDIYIKATDLNDFGFFQLYSDDVLTFEQNIHKIIYPLSEENYYQGSLDTQWTKSNVIINNIPIEAKLIENENYISIEDAKKFYSMTNNNPIVYPKHNTINLSHKNNIFYHKDKEIGYISEEGIPFLSFTYIKNMIGLNGERKQYRSSWIEYAKDEHYSLSITKLNKFKNSLLKVYWDNSLVYLTVIKSPLDFDGSDFYMPLTDIEKYLNLDLIVGTDSPITRTYEMKNMDRILGAKDDWVYYRTASNGLVAMNLSTGVNRIIDEESCENYLNTMDGYIYYKKWGSGVHRIRVNGNESEKLTSSDVIRISVNKDGIFYLQSESGEVGDFFRVNLDGTNLTKIIDDPDRGMHFTYCLEGNHITYAKRDGIYQVDIDGSNKKMIKDTKDGFREIPDLSNKSWHYFDQFKPTQDVVTTTETKDGNVLCGIMRINYNTKEIKHYVDIVKDSDDYVHTAITDKNVFYTLENTPNILYRVDL